MTDSALPGAARRFRNGLLDDNPIYRQLLGMCPTLAVTATLAGAVTMAAATAFVMIMASVVVALLKNQLKGHLRILVFTLTIATFVTIIDRVLQAYVFEMSLRLGSYIPLIIVNCIIICRCEVCASQQSVGVAISDAVGQSVGFLVGLTSIAVIREILATGMIFESVRVMPEWWPNWAVMQGPAGAFITLGLLIGLVNWLSIKRVWMQFLGPVFLAFGALVVLMNWLWIKQAMTLYLAAGCMVLGLLMLLASLVDWVSMRKKK